MANPLPDWLVVCIWRALLGEIYPAIRAIAIAFSSDGTLKIRYYVDRATTEDDQENMEVLATSISSSIGISRVKRIDLDCQYETSALGDLDPLDGFIYCRREWQ